MDRYERLGDCYILVAECKAVREAIIMENQKSVFLGLSFRVILSWL